MSLAPVPDPVRAFLQSVGVPSERLADPEPLLAFLERLRRANRDMNLTRITETDDFWYRHVCDSLAVVSHLPELARGAPRIADVGCGAGFPMIPLLWAFPELDITGIESRNRKAAFVEESVRELGFSEARCVHVRAREAAKRAEFSQGFDVVLARAVARSARLIQECRGLLAVGGRLVCYKTPNVLGEELEEARQEARKQHLAVTVGEEFQLPNDQGRRLFIEFRRERTPVSPDSQASK